MTEQYDGELVKKLLDTVHEAMTLPLCWEDVVYYQGIGGEAFCGVRIYSNGQRATVILTELRENKGTSVTNWYERLATMVLRGPLPRYLPESAIPAQVTWAEHYEDRPKILSQVELQFDRRLAEFSAPKWRFLRTDADVRNALWLEPEEAARVPA